MNDVYCQYYMISSLHVVAVCFVFTLYLFLTYERKYASRDIRYYRVWIRVRVRFVPFANYVTHGHFQYCWSNNVAQCWMKILSRFKLKPTWKHLPTSSNMVFKRGQHCCIQQCCASMLHPTMLHDFGPTCCSRLNRLKMLNFQFLIANKTAHEKKFCKIHT